MHSSVFSNVRCHYCKELFIASNGASTMGLEVDGNSDLICQVPKMKAAFFSQVNKGGPCIPTELVRLSCLYIWNFYQTLDACELLDKMYASKSPSIHFTGMVDTLMANKEHSNKIIQTRYGQEHSFPNNFKQICQKMFNMVTKNYVSQIKARFKR